MADKLLKFRQMAKLLGARVLRMKPSFYKQFDSMNLDQFNYICAEYYDMMINCKISDFKQSCIRCKETMSMPIEARHEIDIDGKTTLVFPCPDYVADDIELRGLLMEVSIKTFEKSFCNEVRCDRCNKINYFRYYRYTNPNFLQKVPQLLAELAKLASDSKKTRAMLIDERDAALLENQQIEEAIDKILATIS